MQQHRYECKVCHTQHLIAFRQQYIPNLSKPFETVCPTCKQITIHKHVPTKKTKSSFPRQKMNHQHEQKMPRKQGKSYTCKEDKPWLRRALANKCKEYGFTYRFLYRSIIVTTPLADWCFDYHLPRITLYHESTAKINFETGNYAKSHVQFRDRKMNPLTVIDFIATHEEWCASHRAEENKSLHSCAK